MARRKGKRFIESKNEALSLAASIGESQEEKDLVRKKKNYERLEARQNREEHRISSNNSRLEKAKEIVRARSAQMKKRKAEMRKITDGPEKSSETQAPRRKGVSFA